MRRRAESRRDSRPPPAHPPARTDHTHEPARDSFANEAVVSLLAARSRLSSVRAIQASPDGFHGPDASNAETHQGRLVMSSSTTIANSSVLVTGANRGLGRALVEAALRRGAKRVYAGARRPYTHPDHRVTPLTLDITDPAQIQAAIE